MESSGIDVRTVEAARKGDRGAREDLVRAAYPGLFRYALRLCRGREADAEELAQEAVVRALTALGDLRDLSRFRPWLLQIALNLHRNRFRRPEPAPLPEVAAPSKDQDFDEWLGHAMDLLPEDQRLCLHLKFTEGLEYDEIAATLDVAQATARSYVFRGLQSLRAKFFEGDHE